jgi:hypothetical protein
LARGKGADGSQFVGSALFEIDLLTGHEPGIPRGETPPSTAGGTPAATDDRFMGSAPFETDLLTGHASGIPASGAPTAKDLGSGGWLRCIVAGVLGGVGMIGVAHAATQTAPDPVTLESALPALVIFTNAATWARTTSADAPGEVLLHSPEIRSVHTWNELVVSWNVEPAAGAGLAVVARAQVGERWTREYRLGQWSLNGESPLRRTSLDGESDADGTVKTDTLVMREGAVAVSLSLRLSGTLAPSPERFRWVTVSLCDTRKSPEPRPARRSVWGTTLEVPERSQVAYLDGRAWCSPTSVSMMLAWWSRRLSRPEWDQDVPTVAAGVHDPGWPGTGNWPFNTAYAGSFPGMRACAARLRDLRDVEDLVAAGIPVVLSVNAPALRGKPVAPDGGHLVICVGFTAKGDVVANDPWARLEEGQRVRRVYLREHVDRAWAHAHRLAYLIAPEAQAKGFPAVWR